MEEKGMRVVLAVEGRRGAGIEWHLTQTLAHTLGCEAGGFSVLYRVIVSFLNMYLLSNPTPYVTIVFRRDNGCIFITRPTLL